MERCDICKCEYKTVYTVPDFLWSDITKNDDLSGLWCLPCFLKEVEKRGFNVYWECSMFDYPGSHPPVMPIFCNECPVVNCHKQTKYGSDTCIRRINGALRWNSQANLKLRELANKKQQTKDVISPKVLLECSCGWIGEEGELRAINNAPPVCPDCSKDNDFTEYSEEQLRNILLHVFGGF